MNNCVELNKKANKSTKKYVKKKKETKTTLLQKSEEEGKTLAAEKHAAGAVTDCLPNTWDGLNAKPKSITSIG